MCSIQDFNGRCKEAEPIMPSIAVQNFILNVFLAFLRYEYISVHENFTIKSSGTLMH